MEEIQVFDGIGAIEQIQRAEIDIQIATAHQYPRSMTVFKKRATEMVTMDEETAASCIYRRPVGGGKFAEGKSIRMAEIVGASYGNLRVAAIIVEQTERFVKCRGMAHDLESNFAASSEVIESTVDKQGKPYSERMRIVVAKACLAKARRDATFQVVPGALCKTLEEAARETAIGTIKTLDDRRNKLHDWVKKLGIEEDRVWAVLEIEGIDDVGLKELELLTGLKTAIQEKDVTIAETFPSLDAIKKATDMGDKAKAAMKTEEKPDESKTDSKSQGKAEDKGDVQSESNDQALKDEAEQNDRAEHLKQLAANKGVDIKVFTKGYSFGSLIEMDKDQFDSIYADLVE